MKRILILFLLCSSWAYSQDQAEVLGMEEFLAMVKKYHPIVKQSDLQIQSSEAKLMKARGAFDPKIGVDWDQKEFAGSQYYDKINTYFKIPTWYGLEFIGKYENNTGTYLNPERKVPEGGLYNVGVSLSLAQGFLMDQRMASVRKAKAFEKQALADQKLVVNSIMFQAMNAYYDWLKTYDELEVYENYLKNAQGQYQGVKTQYDSGDIAAIDTLEASINLNNRIILKEKADLNYQKSSLALSNFLWIEDIPVELKGGLYPQRDLIVKIDEVLELSQFEIDSVDLSLHPKLQSLNYKLDQLKIDQKLKRNQMLPDLKVQYYLLDASTVNDPSYGFSTENYKSSLTLNIPILLRKDRANLKLNQYKIEDMSYQMDLASLELSNKIKAIETEINTYEGLLSQSKKIVTDYESLASGEQQKFLNGDSSLFKVYYREGKWLESQLKNIQTYISYLGSKSKLRYTLAL